MAKELLLHGENLCSDVYKRLELNKVDSRICSRPRIISILSSLFDRLVLRNERHGAATAQLASPSNLTVFHGLRAPNISIDKYLERIFKYANCSPSCFAVAYIYIDRFLQHKPSLPITSLNVHRLLVTSVMVAAKFLDDAYYNNAFYAKVGGVNTQEMNRLELEFLFHLNFRLQVTVSVFESYCGRLDREMSAIQQQQMIERPIQIQIQQRPQLMINTSGSSVACGLDQGENSAQGKSKLDQQRTAVRCSIAGL